ncbi:MAG: hypothetical protein KJ915_10740 [Candidatus Omnitrophica bacterium]|nr:hypothetical protein [Candidatus Omnitrophota bacterium]
MFKNKQIFIIISLVFLIFSVNSFAAEVEKYDCFTLLPWAVGQFVEYQIIGIENGGVEDRYKVSVIGEETVDNETFFWIRFEIIKNRQLQIAFKALVLPLSETEFARNPEIYLSQWLMWLLSHSKQLILELPNNQLFKVDSKEFFKKADEFLGDSFFNEISYEKSEVDYSKLTYDDSKVNICVLAGVFDCFRFLVRTTPQDSFDDEGIDLWRSEKVPFLGIVKMEFSIVGYKEKNRMREIKRAASNDWLAKIYNHFFSQRIPYRERKDIHIMELVDFKSN